jgi:uncharacterized protein
VSAGRGAVHAAGAPARLLVIGLIQAYRLTLSGLLGGQCRFYPSCSSYGLDAIRLHGATKGTLLTMWRVARCGPFTDGGVDPVPPVKPASRNEIRAEYDVVIPQTVIPEITISETVVPRSGGR